MAPTTNLPEIHPATQPLHIPHEVVTEILARLPIGLLQRFRRVSKAWRDTILGVHLRHQRRKDPWLLITPEIESKACDNRGRCSTYAGWYRWEEGQSDLVYAPGSPWLISKGDFVHRFTHCDGLVLMPAETTVRVLNPATCRVLELPLSPCGEVAAEPLGDFYRHQTFGLGHDPRSDTYKVVRLFCGSQDMLTMSSSLRVEVFAIGTDRHWREIVAQPPYPVIAGWTATYCKGFLFWIIDYRWVHKDDHTQGLVCFSLEDESFSIMSTPMRIDSTCILAELRGELCVANQGPIGQSLEMWMCSDFVGGVNPPSWYRPDINNVLMFPYQQLGPCPLAAFRDGGNFFECALSHDLFRFDAQTGKCESWVEIKDLRFQDPAKDKGTFIVERVFSFNVIPYIPSLVPV